MRARVSAVERAWKRDKVSREPRTLAGAVATPGWCIMQSKTNVWRVLRDDREMLLRGPEVKTRSRYELFQYSVSCSGSVPPRALFLLFQHKLDYWCQLYLHVLNVGCYYWHGVTIITVPWTARHIQILTRRKASKWNVLRIRGLFACWHGVCQFMQRG